MKLLKDVELKNVFSNTIFQVIVKFTTSFSTLFVSLLISYFLGFDAFGSFTKIVTFVAFFYLLVDFYLNPIFIKHHFKKIESQFANLVFLRLLLSTFFLFVVFLIVFFLPYNKFLGIGFSDSEKVGIIIYSFTLITFALQLSVSAIVQKNLLYKLTIFPNVSASALLIILVTVGVMLNNFYFILFSFVISSSLLFFLILLGIKNRLSIEFKSNNFYSFGKEMLAYSSPLAAMLFFNIAYSKADVFILSLFRPSFDVGVYGFSYRIFEFIIAIPTFLSISVYPILIEKNNSYEFNYLVKKYLKILLLISVVFVIIIFLLAPIIKLLKNDFSYSVVPLQILSFSLPFFFATSLMQWVLVIKNRIKILLFIYFLSMILNIVLNIIFIPYFSYYAASIITVLSEGLVFIMMFVYLVFKKVEILKLKA